MHPIATNPDQAGLDALAPPVQEAIRRALHPDENVLWAGRPVALAAWGDIMPAVGRRTRLVLYLLTASVGIFVLGSFLLLLIIGMGSDIQKGNWGISDTLWMLLFLPIMFLLVVTPLFWIIYPWLSIREARLRSYVLTDRQALVAIGLTDDVTLERTELGTVMAPSLNHLRKDGVGDITFGGYTIRWNTGDGGSDVDTHIETGFTACPEAERVMSLFIAARGRRRGTHTRGD